MGERGLPGMGIQGRPSIIASKKGAIIAVVVIGVALAVACVGVSSKFVLGSKEDVTSSFNLSMQAEDGQNTDVAAFTRKDGNLSITFAGSLTLFEGKKGSLQGTMEDEYSGGGVAVVRLADPHYDRTTYLRAAHYTTYVLRPDEGATYGIWGIRIVDDNGTEPDACYWMNIRSDGTVALGTEMPGSDWATKIANIESSDFGLLDWTADDKGIIRFDDAEGRAFTVSIENVSK